MNVLGSRTRLIALAVAVMGTGIGAVATNAAAGAPVTTVTHTAKYSVSCAITEFGTETLTGSITATTPATVARGSQFSATGVQITLNFPPVLVNSAISLGVTQIGGTLTGYAVNNSRATPATVDAATGSVATPQQTLVANEPVVLTFTDASGAPLALGPWTAGKPGVDTFSAGATGVNFNNIISGAGLVTQATCTPPSPAKLWTVKVS